METLKKGSYFTGEDKIFLNKSVYLPSLEEHDHEFLEIVYIYSGSGIHYMNGREYKVTRGDLFFINYHVSHTFKPSSEDFRWINCLFLPEVLDASLIHSDNAKDLLQLMLFRPFFDEPADFLFNLNLRSRQKEFRSLFEDMLEEYEKKAKGYPFILRSYLMILIAKIFRVAGEKQEEASSERETGIIDKALDYLQQNYSKPLRLEEIAREVLLSPTYFASVFKNATGYSLLDYIHRTRIEEACSLLTSSNNSVGDVMRQVGYRDSKFFYQIFKRHTGMTPGQYKKHSAQDHKNPQSFS